MSFRFCVAAGLVLGGYNIAKKRRLLEKGESIIIPIKGEENDLI